MYTAPIDPRQPQAGMITCFDGYEFRSEDRGQTWARLGGLNQVLNFFA
jgi:hypothetical protein